MAKNVVLICLDDATELDGRILNSPLYPAIAQHIGSGIRFANAFATSSLCSPSRASIFKGQYPHNHGVRTNLDAAALDESDTLASRLRPTHRTIHVGKYMNGYGEASPSYVPYGYDDWHGLERATYSVYDYRINHNGLVTQYGHTLAEYQTAVLGDIAALSVMAGLGKGKPLFVQVCPMAPHIEDSTIAPTLLDGFQEGEDPWRWFARPDIRDKTGAKAAIWSYIANPTLLPNYVQLGPSFNEADVSDKPLFMRNELMDAADRAWADYQYRTRLLCLLPVNDIVGKIAAALPPAELANTIWILTSDNGFMLGEHRKAQKLAAYEPSIRVPLYLAGAGVPHVEQGIALLQDLYPTLLELAGVAANPAIDGRSLVPLLTPGATWPRRRFLLEHTQEGDGSAPDLPTFAGLRTGPGDTYPQRAYVEYVTGDRELYELATDQGELTSVHADPLRAAEIADHHAKLEALKASSGAGCQVAEN